MIRTCHSRLAERGEIDAIVCQRHVKTDVGAAPRAYGSQLGFHPLRIRRAARIACSEPQRLVQFVQLDQHKRLVSDFASASHAEGRWFDPSRDHQHWCRSGTHFCDLGGLKIASERAKIRTLSVSRGG